MANNEEATWPEVRVSDKPDDLRHFGPTITIGIAPLPFIGIGMQTVRALIDTGAHGTAITPSVAKSFGVAPIREAEIREAGRQPMPAKVYRARLFLTSTIEIDAEVHTLPNLSPPHDVLIGRNVLAGTTLGIDFIGGFWFLQVKPSQP
jgi:predicted aspartyl protease